MRLHWRWASPLASLGLAAGLALGGCSDSGGSGSGSEEGGTADGGADSGGGETGEGGTDTGEGGGGSDAGEGGADAGGEGSEDTGEGGGEGQPDGGSPGEPIVNLLSDHNRNGRIDLADPTEDDAEDTWNEQGGAIFLANLDDDLETCPKFQGNDYELAACHDGADEVVNGEADLSDMAPLHVVAWPDAPADAVGRLFWSPNKAAAVRVFKKAGDSVESYEPWLPAAHTLTAEELRAGADFYLEGTNVVVDRESWDGYVDVSLRIERGGEVLGEDKVRLRVAPLMLFHHLLPGERVYAAIITGSQASVAFRSDIDTALTAAAMPPDNFWEYASNDQWTQDYFEPGVMTMPGPDGEQKEMRIHIRSANVFGSDPSPLRPAGRIVYTWRGPDTAALQLFDITHPGSMDSLDSFGNTETIPPYTYNGVTYPLGRLYRGSVPNFYPDPKQSKMFEDQVVQSHVYTDTSWLLVGHVDETITFLTYPESERGWVILSNDPTMAKQMLEDQVAAGNGAVTMFKGKKWAYPTSDAEISIQGVLDNTNVMNESLKSAAEVIQQELVLKEATGLTDEEIYHIPYLHESVQGYSLAYQVGTINGLVLDAQHYLSPKTHGPEIDGLDIMEQQFEDVLSGLGFTVHWVENWDLYHALSGEVHCGSNTMRVTPDVKWWETGR